MWMCAATSPSLYGALRFLQVIYVDYAGGKYMDSMTKLDPKRHKYWAPDPQRPKYRPPKPKLCQNTVKTPKQGIMPQYQHPCTILKVMREGRKGDYTVLSQASIWQNMSHVITSKHARRLKVSKPVCTYIANRNRVHAYVCRQERIRGIKYFTYLCTHFLCFVITSRQKSHKFRSGIVLSNYSRIDLVPLS